MSAVNDPTPPGTPQANATGGEAIQASPPPAGSSTAVQTAPATEPPAIPLPPRPPREPITPAELGRAMARLDRMLVPLVLLLTFFVALFPVRNSDFWLHLATGRDLLHNLPQWMSTPGTDPYSYTGTGSWVNHSWLTDVLLYGVYQSLGGPAVVILKAVLVSALVALMLSLRRRGQGLWLPGVGTALAVLALSPRLLLQPAVISFLFLGITVAVLLRRELRAEPDGARKRPAAPVPWLGEPADRWLWILPPLFALWVNLDAWFFVGPLALALYLGGTLVEGFLSVGKPDAARPGAWRPLAAVLAAGLIACLLSPFGFRGLTLPDELGARDVLAQLQDDDTFSRMLTSPLDREYFRIDLGLNLAGLAYFPLVLAGLASFWLSGLSRRWGRALVWFGFLVLSIGHARAIPFFAIVAGPITALNFQEYSAARFGTVPVAVGWWKEWSLLGRGLSVLGVFGLALLAWPGWLFGFPGDARREAFAETRRVGLRADPPPTLVKLAAQLDAWHRDGTLREDAWLPDGTLREGDHVFNLQPDVSNTLAWLCREHREKCFFDYRFENYSPEVAADYVKLRQAFDPPPGKPGELAPSLGQAADLWRTILKARKIAFVIIYNSTDRFQAIRVRSASAAPFLVTLYLDGHTAVYGVREMPLLPRPNRYLAWLREERNIALPPLAAPEEDRGRFKGHEFDAWTLAFGPGVEKLPDVKPRRPESLPVWTRFAFGAGAPAPETGDAATYLNYFDETAFRWHYERALRPQAAVTFTGLAAGAGGRTGNVMADAFSVGTLTHVALRRLGPAVQQDALGPIITGPTSPVLLAVRSARRAIQRNPEDAEAYFQLGRAYGMLARQTMEHQVGSRFALLGQLREIQAIAALRNAVLIKPDRGPAHALLSHHFARAHYDDLYLKHFGEYIRWFRSEAKRRAGSGESFDRDLELMERDYKKLEDDVSTSRNLYEVQSDKKRVLEKASTALQLGLAEKALQVLLESDPLEFGDRGTRMELDLLLRTGRLGGPKGLRDQLDPANDPATREELPQQLNNTLGAGTYETYRFYLAAAEGDYAEADTFLEDAGTQVRNDPRALSNLRRELGLLDKEGKVVDTAKDLTLRELIALGVARLVGDAMPNRGPVTWLLGQRLDRDRRLGTLRQMVGPLQMAADYDTLRGLLKLESGDIHGAEQSFRQAIFADKDKKGQPRDIVFEFTGLPVAFQYLRLIEQKERLVEGQE